MNNGYPFLNVLYASSPCAAASPSPTFDTPVPTADCFTVNVTNYDALYTWALTVGDRLAARGRCCRRSGHQTDRQEHCEHSCAESALNLDHSNS